MRDQVIRCCERLETSETVHRAAGLIYGARRKMATGGVALLAVWLAFHVVFGANGWVVYANKRIEYRKLQIQVQSLTKENEALSKQVDSLQNDPKAIEKEAREQLGYTKPGEKVFLLPGRVPEKAKDAAAAFLR